MSARPETEGSADRAQVLRDYLTDNDLDYTEADGVFSFALPGERKLQTPVRLDLGPHALGVHAFVCRNPDENHERVYRWLLERNLKTYAVSYAVDHAARFGWGATAAGILDVYGDALAERAVPAALAVNR